MDDTHALREQLARAWRITLETAIEQGMPERAVVETMAAVAQARLVASFGPAAAASYLQLMAEEMREIDQNETAMLVCGDDVILGPSAPDLNFDFASLMKDDLLD